MDGFLNQSSGGILYAEDFDDPVSPPPPPRAPVSVTALTQTDVDAACIRAVQAAELAWEQGAAERRTAALEALVAGLADARAGAKAQAEALADGIAQTALGMVAALLPELCRRHGDAEVRALAKQVLPAMGPCAGAVVRAHAGVVELIRQDLASLDETLAEAIDIRPVNLPHGDMRITWEDGGLTRDSEAIQDSIRNGLMQLGLLGPTVDLVEQDQPHVPPNPTVLEFRSHAHVQ